MLVIIIIVLFLVITYKIADINKKKEEKEWNEKTKNILKEKEKYYSDYSKRYDDVLNIYKQNEYYLDSIYSHYAIIDNKIKELYHKPEISSISLESMKSDIRQKEYNITDIEYYKLEGSVENLQYISGGGGGGSSIKGAIVGSLIAGGTGAIIGSRKKVDEIKTTYEKKDTRVLQLIFKDGSIKSISYQYYEKLLDYAPEKDYDTYITNKKSKK